MKHFFLILILFLTQAGFAHQGCDFFPANNLRFPIRPTGHMSEQTFKHIMQVVSDTYQPIFTAEGRPTFKVVQKWTDDTLNAWAFICNDPSLLSDPTYPKECARMRSSLETTRPVSLITMYGGLARHPLMTPEGMVLVACHEIGHHLGGFPRKEQNKSWAATEGQSDYFATMKCGRKIFRAMGDNDKWLKTANVPFYVRNQCNRSFPGHAEDQAICMRSSMAGLALARVLGSLGNQAAKTIDFQFTDKRTVPITFEEHPEAQCRLDTYFAGSLCEVNDEINFAEDNALHGACVKGHINNQGPRPACWFH